MRNIIFTSVLACLGTAGMADDLANGCFIRSYSDAHLTAHPDQIAAKMRFLLYTYDNDGTAFTAAAMDVEMADQGRVAGSGLAGQRFGQWLICDSRDGVAHCGVECDGGSFEITGRSKDSLTLRTDYLRVSDCDAFDSLVDLAEIPGEFVTYRLDAAPAAACEGMQTYAY